MMTLEGFTRDILDPAMNRLDEQVKRDGKGAFLVPAANRIKTKIMERVERDLKKADIDARVRKLFGVSRLP